MPPAQTTGTPRSANSSKSSSALVSPGVAAGPVVDRDQAVDAALEPLLGPLALGDVVIDDAADGVDLVDNPPRIAERRDEEAHALLERDVDPADHSLVVGLRRRLDERVHADRLRRQLAHVAGCRRGSRGRGRRSARSAGGCRAHRPPRRRRPAPDCCTGTSGRRSAARRCRRAR